MNDRLKFRVFNKKYRVYKWDEDFDTNKKLDFDCGYYEPKMLNVHSLHLGTNKVIVFDKYGNHSLKLSDDVILMQSTGLKDKNGKLVFEGDIIKYDDTEEMSFWTRGEIGVVKFKPGRFSICLSPAYDGKMTGTSNMMQEDMEDCITIIGNIHQDSHLLEAKNFKGENK